MVCDTEAAWFEYAVFSVSTDFPFSDLRRTNNKEAILDIWMSGSRWTADAIVDFTVRDPCALRDLNESSWASDGAEVMEGEVDARDTYTSRQLSQLIDWALAATRLLQPHTPPPVAVRTRCRSFTLQPSNGVRRWRLAWPCSPSSSPHCFITLFVLLARAVAGAALALISIGISICISITSKSQ